MPSPARFPAVTAALSCDLAVVGGGYTGLWTAIRAKQQAAPAPAAEEAPVKAASDEGEAPQAQENKGEE